MKKLIASAIILSMLAAMTGCKGKDDNNTNDAQNTEASTSASVSEPAESNGETAGTAEAGAATNEAADTTPANEEDVPPVTPEDGESHAAAIAQAVSEAVQFPMMGEVNETAASMEIEPAELASTMYGIDLSLCSDYYLSGAMISAQLNEIIVVKPTEGSEDALKAALDAHFEYIKNDAAFYPAQELSAAGAVQGETASGYYYIIVHEDGETAANAIIDM